MTARSRVTWRDVQGGTTREGIHLGAMTGTVDILQRGYTGIEIRDDVLWLNPLLPDPLRRLQIRIRYRGQWLRLEVEHERLTVEFRTRLGADRAGRVQRAGLRVQNGRVSPVSAVAFER